jgi:glycosyltransferase involved in cell wall biosynthesis
MSTNADVSVVMSVYNGASELAVTMNSVLSQAGVDLEFIIVNDGSTDRSGEILDDYALSDSRVRVIHQKNTGLTGALIRGCAAATGEFIARQDAGDVSLAGRLASQSDVLKSDLAIVMTSCGSRYIGPNGEVLFEICQHGEELHRNLQQLNSIRRASSHTSVMFRRNIFEQVGGYRPQFKVAQDIDLFMRLSEAGICWATPGVLCELHLNKRSISAALKAEQLRAARLIVKCAAIRRSGRDDSELVKRYTRQHKWRELFRWTPQRLLDARFYYFIGSVLRHRQPEQAESYFWSAVSAWFAYPRAWWRIWELRGRTPE